MIHRPHRPAIAFGIDLPFAEIDHWLYRQHQPLPQLSPRPAPAIAVAYAAMTADSARRHYAGRGGAWKGRVEIREKPQARIGPGNGA